MFNFLKKTICACAITCCAISALFSQEGIAGSDAPDNFAWDAPTKDDTAFKLIALDGKQYSLYVNTGAFFAPVKTSGRSFTRMYYVPKTDKVTFYKREEIASGAKGKAMYIPVASVDCKDSADWIFALYARSGKVSTAKIDVSLANMPVSTLTMINMNPAPMGFQVAKKAIKLGFFQTYQSPDYSGKNRILSFDVNAFSLRGPKPVYISSSTYSFWSFERMLVCVFEEAQEEKTMGIPSNVVPPDESTAPVPTGNASIIIIKDKGPR